MRLMGWIFGHHEEPAPPPRLALEEAVRRELDKLDQHTAALRETPDQLMRAVAHAWANKQQQKWLEESDDLP